MKYYCDNYRHLVCIPYSIENLHRMANKLNINKCWFHKDHYDIPVKRIKDVQLKSVIVRQRDILKIIQGKWKREMDSPHVC